MHMIFFPLIENAMSIHVMIMNGNSPMHYLHASPEAAAESDGSSWPPTWQACCMQPALTVGLDHQHSVNASVHRTHWYWQYYYWQRDYTS